MRLMVCRDESVHVASAIFSLVLRIAGSCIILARMLCCCQYAHCLLLVFQGIIQHCTINNLAFGRSVEEAKRTLQAIQYVQENPDEVCPAGWQPGSNTMKPTPKDSKEYFAAL